VLSSVVQVLRFWGQGCVRREEQRGERSDSASQRAQKPHLHPRETTDKERCRGFWAYAPALLSWWGLALDRCLRCVWSEGRGS